MIQVLSHLRAYKGEQGREEVVLGRHRSSHFKVRRPRDDRAGDTGRGVKGGNYGLLCVCLWERLFDIVCVGGVCLCMDVCVVMVGEPKFFSMCVCGCRGMGVCGRE